MVLLSKFNWDLPQMELFTEKLVGFFKAPMLRPLMPESSSSAPTPTNEFLVSEFIGFLLETIKELNTCNNADLIDPVKKEIGMLEKELKFVHIFLENAPMRCDEIDGLEGLLPEINDAANQTGSLLYKFFFTKDGAKEARVHLELDVLLRKIEWVTTKMKNHCLSVVQKLLSCASTRTSGGIFSPFVLHFLQEDLKYLLNRQADLIRADEKTQISKLCDGLMSLRSLLRDVEVARQYGGLGELGKLVAEIREVSYDAGCIVNSFVIGGASSWSFTVEVSNAISNAINRIELITMELVEMKKSYGIGVRRAADDHSEKAPLLSNKPPRVDDVIVGFQRETIEILEQIAGGTDQLQILSIFGMPGLGKTTLAKKLYNDPVVVYQFDRRAWCVCFPNISEEKSVD
ncbi:UNVERIFIED_CONTAM: putative late blight resistance proteinR1B-19 [Sesamum radiatum]|uniref:Late blight resistance proteinR1B-19 n=1 Tax=Sesamum radiatum TaxID=300843 RepID=A0AAW2RE41_SESRA